MAVTAYLVQTEKAYNLQTGQTFAVIFGEGYNPNKIELTKVLKKHQLDTLQIRVVNLPSKTKRVGAKRRTRVRTRPTKYYIKLKVGQSLDDKKLAEIFPQVDKVK